MAASNHETTTPRFYLALAAAKATTAALKLARRAGGQLPGVVAETIDPRFFGRVARPARIVFISGTNGKTTTNNLLNDLLSDNGWDVITNPAGGNVWTGIESQFLRNATLTNRARKDWAVMELDELSFRKTMPFVTPEMVLVTNLYRDTFSRNGNPDYIFDVMSKSLDPSVHLLLNADDLISCRMAPQCKNRTYFSVCQLPGDEPEAQGIAKDLPVCPECGGKLAYDYCHMRHIGHARCERCGLTNPQPDYEVTSVNRADGTFDVLERKPEGEKTFTYRIKSYSITNLYNLLATVVAARELGLSPQQIAKSLKGGVNIIPERLTERRIGGKRVMSLAIKSENATAASVVLDTIRKEPGTKAVVLMLSVVHKADNPTQIEFMGWLYQADFEYLNDPSIKQVVLEGEQNEDLLLRLLLAGIPREKISVVATPEEAARTVDVSADSVFLDVDIFSSHPKTEAFCSEFEKRMEAGRSE